MSNGLRTVMMLAVGTALLAQGGIAAAGPDASTEVRRLLPDAASMDPFVLHKLMDLGGAVQPADLKQHASLTAVVLLFRSAPAWPPGASSEFRVGDKITPADYLKAVYGGTLPAEPIATRRPTILRAEYIQTFTIQQDGDAATGVITFKAGEVYAGTVQYEARRNAGTWAITAFEFPKHGARLEGKGRAWRLVTAPTGSVVRNLSVVVGSGDAMPAEFGLTVSLREDGTAWHEGTIFNLAHEDPVQADRAIHALGKHLGVRAKAGPHEPDESSALNLILVADAGAEWQYAQWILQAAASQRVYRIYFAVQPRGADEPAVLQSFLPRDRGLMATQDLPPEFSAVKISLFRRNRQDAAAEQYTLMKVGRRADRQELRLPKGWPARRSDPALASAYRAAIDHVRQVMESKVKAAGADARGEIVTPPPKGGWVPCEDILNLLAILRGAGVEEVTFEGRATPLTHREREALRQK